VAGLGGFTFGYNTGIISTARDPMLTDFGIFEKSRSRSLIEGLITSSILFGAMIGSLFGSTLATKLGQRVGTLIASAICMVGLLTQSFAPEIYTTLVFRIIQGCGIGLIGVLCPMYANEAAPHDQKGIFGVLFQLTLTFGIVVSNVVGWAFLTQYNNAMYNWRIMTGIGILFPLLLFIVALTRMKETQHAADENATLLRAVGTDNTNYQRGGFTGLFLDNFRFVFLGIIFSATLQLTGINAVMFFGPSILQSAGIDNAYALNIGVGSWNFLTTIFAIVFVERLGRKKLMIGGTVLLTLALFFIGIGFHFFSGTMQGVMVGIGLALYILGFEGGPGCLFWVVVSEAFPPHIRGAGNSFCNIVQWGFNLLISTTFPIVKNALGSGRIDIIFYVYGGIGVICVFFLTLMQKETKDD